MSKYIEITQKLRTIEQGRFQILCIEYLKYNVGGIVHSPGTVDGKEKTKKGHPDVYLKQDDGKYVLGECTTKDDLNTVDFNAKLEQDLKACLDFDKLEVAQEKVDSVYLCCNSSVEASLFEHLECLTKPLSIGLKIIGLHELAIHFSSAGKVFAKDSLGIDFQTGQVLTKSEFLKQYQKKNLSTPLDNPLLGRERELSMLADQLNLHDLIILTGPAGVGKSRLVIEAMDIFIVSNPEFTPYYIFPKSSEITSDLATFLKPEKSYVLLIDDANRQLDNLIKVLEKIIESEMRLKVIITVRDYAKDDVIKQCGKMETNGFILKKLSDDYVKDIVSQDPFSINDWDIINRIVQISDGNPRLAIMAAEIMRSDPDISLLSDVTKIYDAYFDNILSDKEIFNQKYTRQVLGIVSFFYTIDTAEVQEQDIITSFGLKIDEFIECAEQLEELEIIEIYDGSVVRISEQVIATYFFYDCFFRNPVLDLSHLLAHCYKNNIYRLKDSVIPSINAFGENNVIGKKQSEWLSFWNVIKENRETAISFMRIFGKYFPDLFFTWISSFKSQVIESHKNTFHYEDLAKPNSRYQTDEILNLLEIFFIGSEEKFQTAVYLSFEYAQGQAEVFAILIDKLKTNLHITKSEIAKGLPKIDFIYGFLIDKAKLDGKYKTALYLIMDQVILRASWRTELYHQIDDRYVLKDILKTFRSKLLKDYLDDYKSQKPFILSLLLDYVWEKRELRYPEIDEDFPIITQIIEKFMGPNDFSECYFVNKYIAMVGQKSSSYQKELESFQEKFKSNTYDLYSLLSMKYHLTKKGTTWEEFYNQKTKEISGNISIQSLDDFIKIHNELSTIMHFRKHRSDISDGVAILIRSILLKDIGLCMECLEYFLKEKNIVFLNGTSILAPIFTKGKEVSDRFYSLINQYDYQNKNEWINSFFLFIPEELIEDHTIENLIGFYVSHNGPIDIYASHYVKYEAYRTGTRARILAALHNNRKNNDDFTYKLAHNFFQESPELLTLKFELCKEVYFQQEEMPGNYDQDGRELMLLLEKDDHYFDSYFDWFTDTESKLYVSEHKVLSRIWGLETAEVLVYRSLLKIVKIRPYSRSEHLACIFFYSTKEEHHEIAYGVLQKIVTDFPRDKDVLNMVIDTVRNSFNQFHLPLIQQIIKENDDLALFKDLEFHNNHFSTSSGEIWSENKSRELKEIKAAILAMPTHYKYFGHKNYLDERIAAEDRNTARQKKYIFRGFW